VDKFTEAFNLLFSMDRELLQILFVTLEMSFFSTTISCLLGMPAGTFLAAKKFRGKRIVKRTVNTLMGLPPVVAGLVVYMLFTRYGPFGKLNVLFSVKAMVIAQVILITPIVTSLTMAVVQGNRKTVYETAKGMGFSKGRIFLLYLTENRTSLFSVILTALGRSIAEVGAVAIVGGNIQWKTRVMTTAIMLETNKGNFSFALALGVILLLVGLVINILASLFAGEKNDDD